ncbi:MAG: hypothetical protein NTX65_15975 [Ignavibacteriales bacterium]|nr:hypothetical protein [Ignavibacteriales bacterium]
MTKFKNTFRIESVRLKEWDYSNPWWYYVTINTKNHVEYFGKIENERMVLSELGLIVHEEWLRTKTIRQNVDLDYFVIMPNHLHGIIILEGEKIVETCRGKSLQQKNERVFSKLIANSLSVIINQFKGAVKRLANKNGYKSFTWQPRFYDRIIHSEKELLNIRNYIDQNPSKWELEKGKPENIFDL